MEREALTKTLMEKGNVRRNVGGGRGFLAKKGSEHSWVWAGWGTRVGLHQSSVLGRDVMSYLAGGAKEERQWRWGRGGGKDLIIWMMKPTAMEIGKANYESCYGKCWMLINSGFGGGEQRTSIC